MMIRKRQIIFFIHVYAFYIQLSIFRWYSLTKIECKLWLLFNTILIDAVFHVGKAEHKMLQLK